MESFNTQLLHLGVLHNAESFKKIYDVDLLGNKSTRLIEKYKYFNSEKRLRVYIPKMLHWILKKDPSFNFYISQISVVETENKSTLYLKIEIDFNFENYKDYAFSIAEIKSIFNAKYLPFNKLDDENFKEDYLFSNFGFLKIIAKKTVLKEIEANTELGFYIEFFQNKHTIILKTN